MKAYITLLIATLLMSCSSSKITSSWKEPNTTTVNFNKIMVVALLNTNEMALQQKMEKHLVDDIKSFGYNAVSAFEQFGPKAFANVKEDEMLSKIKNAGADAVITIVLLNKEKEKYYRPAEIMSTPFANDYGRLYGYFNNMQSRVISTGYYVSNTNYFWESSFYNLYSNKLIYVAQTKSFDPSSANTLAHEYGKKIIADMFTKNILTNKNSVINNSNE
ncbi:MAG: hypothetical protein KA319_07880 [Ferruginibacter sp.]|nr:hypothetical protein [Ferruginibacter sp.]